MTVSEGHSSTAAVNPLEGSFARSYATVSWDAVSPTILFNTRETYRPTQTDQQLVSLTMYRKRGVISMVVFVWTE